MLVNMPKCPDEIPLDQPLRVLRDGEIGPQYRLLQELGASALADDDADLLGAVYEALAFIGPDDEIEADRYGFAVDRIGVFAGLVA
jgi:hypothetical protein